MSLVQLVPKLFTYQLRNNGNDIQQFEHQLQYLLKPQYLAQPRLQHWQSQQKRLGQAICS